MRTDIVKRLFVLTRCTSQGPSTFKASSIHLLYVNLMANYYWSRGFGHGWIHHLAILAKARWTGPYFIGWLKWTNITCKNRMDIARCPWDSFFVWLLHYFAVVMIVYIDNLADQWATAPPPPPPSRWARTHFLIGWAEVAQMSHSKSNVHHQKE